LRACSAVLPGVCGSGSHREVAAEGHNAILLTGIHQNSLRFARQIGIGAAVTHRPLPHHRAYGSVHGGSIGYASNPRLTTEDRGTGSRHSTARPRELWTGPSTTDRDRCRRCYPRAADALPVRSVPRGDDGRFSTVATTRLAVAPTMWRRDLCGVRLGTHLKTGRSRHTSAT
jgi:hypothetical protein